MNTKPRVAILYGGRSVEHEISLRSAENVAAHIDKERFEVLLIGIDKKGSWFLTESVDSNISEGSAIAITLDAGAPAILEADSQKKISIDIVFPVLHGTDGEDGSIQGLFTALDLPVVGSGVLGSAVSMDKLISKKVLNEGGIPVAKYIEFRKSELDGIRFENIVEQLGLPFMIKSANLGSSVGINKVSAEADFESALNESFRYGEKIIVEQFIVGRELECAVIGNEKPRASFPGEIVLIKDYDFYTYTAKYLDEDAIKIELPAKLDEKTTERIRQESVRAYEALRCEDFARVDLFLTEEGEIIINEINTIPGFTNASMFPMMWQHMGMSYTELISELISLCLKRYEAAKSHETDYNVLN